MKDDIANLLGHLEEHLRATQKAGLTFVDPRHLRRSLASKQNHAIFGRRGAGKSTFVKSLLGTEATREHLAIYVNLEDYKDISFPNIILHVLRASFREVAASIKRSAFLWWFTAEKRRAVSVLGNTISELTTALAAPDKQDQTVRTRTATEDSASAGLKIEGASTGLSAKVAREEEVSRTDKMDKLNQLRLNIEGYKEIIELVSRALGERPLFLILDDFYFVPKSVQPEFIDFFHRLTKGTDLFLKIATIKHRSKLYKQGDETYIGMELAADVYEIDMDYTLDKFDDLKDFMRQLLGVAIKDSGACLNVDDLFAGDGFGQLCLASGGVPRDFLSLFVRVARKVLRNPQDRIGKVEVNEEAIAALGNKMDSLKTDSADERETLEAYLACIREFVYGQKRTNVFLVLKPDLETNAQERQALRELVDLRLIHLVDSNTSAAPSDGRRYEAYLLDVGLYENSRPRNFTQLEPGTRDARARRDELRAAPRLDLGVVRATVDAAGPVQPLAITD
ncbi:MAG: hypothetical protein M5U21_08685 [Fimbriimonadaceae bacterium]|nr:hypothetical protein [Fimbriimonadaceae bacterium]